MDTDKKKNEEEDMHHYRGDRGRAGDAPCGPDYGSQCYGREDREVHLGGGEAARG